MNFDQKRRGRVQGGWAAPSQNKTNKSTSMPLSAAVVKPENHLNEKDEDQNKESQSPSHSRIHSGRSDGSQLNPHAPVWVGKNIDQHAPKQTFVYEDPNEEFKIQPPDLVITKPGVYDITSESSGMSSSRMARQLKNRFPPLYEFVGRSQEYVHKFIDSHCHIDLLFARFGLPKDHSYGKFIKDHSDSFPVNYEGCVAIFCDPKTFAPTAPDNTTLKMAQATDNVWLALGCHPKNATRFTDAHLPSLRAALQDVKVKALGEIGLDYSGEFSEPTNVSIQKKVLRQQISLALDLDLPLVIHCRDADTDCLDILKEMVPRDWPIHRHCFTQNLAIAQEWMNSFSNMYIGFTPLVCRTSASVAPIREAAAKTPLDRLLLETDAPYFIPDAVKKGVKLSHPGYALFTAETIAKLKEISVDEVLKACRTNTQNMYRV